MFRPSERYQIIAEYIVCGNPSNCLCTTPTGSGCWAVCYNEEQAKKRVAELLEIGMKAYYEPLPWGTAWFDDENWIG